MILKLIWNGGCQSANVSEWTCANFGRSAIAYSTNSKLRVDEDRCRIYSVQVRQRCTMMSSQCFKPIYSTGCCSFLYSWNNWLLGANKPRLHRQSSGQMCINKVSQNVKMCSIWMHHSSIIWAKFKPKHLSGVVFDLGCIRQNEMQSNLISPQFRHLNPQSLYFDKQQRGSEDVPCHISWAAECWEKRASVRPAQATPQILIMIMSKGLTRAWGP